MAGGKLDIGMLGLGEMGGNIARYLTLAGHSIHALVAGRSRESQQRAWEANIQSASCAEDFSLRSQIVFSVIPSDVALSAARDLAQAARRTGTGFVFVECNAISPALACEISRVFDGRSTFVDGSIIGAPPSARHRPRLYVSGAFPAILRQLDQTAFDLRYLGPRIGNASAIKMVYASMTKGVNALLVNSLLAAEELDIMAPFLEEFRSSQPALAKRADANVARLPCDAARWIPEMAEIAETMRTLGLEPGFHDGAARVMRRMADSPFGAETRRTIDRTRSMEDTIHALAGQSSG